MTDFDIWLKTNIVNKIKYITINICNQMYLDAYIQTRKENTKSNIQTIDENYAVYYINKITDQLNQEMCQSLLNRNFYINAQKCQNPPENSQIIRYKHINNSLLDTAKQSSLYQTFKQFKYPFKLTFLDIETDSLDIHTSNILQISLMSINLEEQSATPFIIKDICTTYVKPYEGYTIDTQNSSFKVNNITQEQINKAPLFKSIASEIVDQTILNTLVGFNIHQFDIPILKRHLQIAGEKPGWTHTIDIGQAYWKFYPSTLSNALKTLGIQHNFQMHDAKSDNIACMHIFEALIQNKNIPNNPEQFLSLINSDTNRTRYNFILEQSNPTHIWISKDWHNLYKNISTHNYKKRPFQSEDNIDINKKLKHQK